MEKTDEPDTEPTNTGLNATLEHDAKYTKMPKAMPWHVAIVAVLALVLIAYFVYYLPSLNIPVHVQQQSSTTTTQPANTITSMPEESASYLLANISRTLTSAPNITTAYNYSTTYMYSNTAIYQHLTIIYARSGNLSRISTFDGSTNSSIFNYSNTYYQCYSNSSGTMFCNSSNKNQSSTNSYFNFSADMTPASLYGTYLNYINLANMQLTIPNYSSNGQIIGYVSLGTLSNMTAANSTSKNASYEEQACRYTNVPLSMGRNLSGVLQMCVSDKYGLPLNFSVYLKYTFQHPTVLVISAEAFNISTKSPMGYIAPSYMSKYIGTG